MKTESKRLVRERRYNATHWEHRRLWGHQRRARTLGIECDLDVEYLKSIYPEDGLCPVFRVPMVKGGPANHPHKATLDRIDNSKGYVKGNVVYVSWRANDLKKNATVSELISLVLFMVGAQESVYQKGEE